MTTQTEITRAVKALKAAGLPVGAVEISPDGTVRVLTAMDVTKKKRNGPRSWGHTNEGEISGAN